MGLGLERVAGNASRRVLDALKRLEVSVDQRTLKVAEETGAAPIQVARYAALFGSLEEARALFSTREEEVMKTIRVNTLKTNRDAVARRLEEKGFRVRAYPYTSYGLVVEHAPGSLGAQHEYLYGYYTLQGPASMLVVPALQPEDVGEGFVLDCCSGAGVKTTQIAQHTDKPIIAVDVSWRKLLALKNNLSRLGVFNVIVIHGDVLETAPRLAVGGRRPAKILADVPCSGEGLWPFASRRRRRTAEDIASRVELQVKILYVLLESLTTGGELVYSTCTMGPEENEFVVSVVVETLERRGCRVELVEPPVPGDPGVNEYLGLELLDDIKLCRRLFPHRHKTEGFTICKLRLGSHCA